MALSAKVGAFNTTTDVATSTVEVTGLGFEPKAIIFWWTKSTSTGTDEVAGGSISTGMGLATSSTSRRVVAMQSEDASAAADTDRFHSDAACVHILTISGATDGDLDVVSFDADGFTLVVDDQFTASYRVHYIAWGGSDITDVATGAATAPAGTGNSDVTGPGFQPDMVIIMASRQTGAPPAQSTNAAISFGFAAGGGQGVLGLGSVHNQTTMDTGSYCYSGNVIGVPSATSPIDVSRRASFVEFISTGFTLNWLETNSGDYVHWLAIKGGEWLVGSLLTQTDTTTDIAESGFGFQPSGALLLSHCNSESSSDTIQDHNRASIGAFSSTTDRGAQGHLDQDNVGDSVCTLAVEHDAVYVNIATDETVQGLMDIKSVDSDGFTCIMDDADPAQAFVTYLAFGSTPAAATAGVPVVADTLHSPIFGGLVVR